jgi:hypothetical protein
MSLSKHFPPSTQAILSAQETPPSRKRTHPHDDSIIIISSSPDQKTPFLSSNDSPLNQPLRVSHEKSIEVLNDEDFTRLLGSFKYSCSAPVAKPLSTHKTNLNTYFRERKVHHAEPKPRIKTTLTSRVSLPKSSKQKPKEKVVEEPSTSFFTTWAAAQAPSIRPAKASAKPRRKPAKKKSVEVILLSPKSGQGSIRREVSEIHYGGKLGQKSGGGMWDACKRGLEGELYDSNGDIVFSQQLRSEDGDSVVKEVEIVSVVQAEDDEPPARRRKELEGQDGIPVYSSFTIPQLQVSLTAAFLMVE